MIISVTRRTDIPSYYGKWFVNRLKEGYVITPNPYNPTRYSKIMLNKEAVDIIVFWTKNPIPFIKYLDEIDKLGYKYYFQFTITPYDKTIESNLPDKNTLLKSFIYLSNRLGKNSVIWRYDPIIINDTLTVDYHIKQFKGMAKILKGYTNKCVISLVDDYKNVSYRMGKNPTSFMTDEKIYELAEAFSKIASENDISISTCSEKIDLSRFNITKSSCIDKDVIESILGAKIDVKIDKNQREECRCVESYEIGTYNSCANGCTYCYALKNDTSSLANIKSHNPNSPLLIGKLNENAIITVKESKSVIIKQMSLF